MVNCKRVYEQVDKKDGFRILVDRLWPRGLTKERAHIDLWLKEIAPSTALRKWYSHDPKKWAEFVSCYHQELKQQKDAIVELKKTLKQNKQATLLFAAKDEERNNAIALKKILKI